MYVLEDAYGYSTQRQRFFFGRRTLEPTMLTVDHSYPQTYIRTFSCRLPPSLSPPLLSFSPTRLSGERLSVIRRGLGGQIAIYSLPVGEVCVSRL